MSALSDRDPALTAEEALPVLPPRSLWRQLLRHNGVMAGGIVLVIIVLIGLAAPFLGTVDPAAIDPSVRNKTPGTEITVRQDDGSKLTRTLWMGSDSLGRDIASQLLVGAQNSIVVGVIAVGIGLVVGVLLLLASFAVLRRSQLARWFGMAVGVLLAVSAMWWMPFYPVWSLTYVAIGTLVVYGLAAHGGRESDTGARTI